MLGYLTILAAALCGLAGTQPWVIAAAAIALASLSYAEHYQLYRRGQDLGLFDLIDTVMIRSILNALAASGIAYGGGWLLRLI